MDDLAISYIHPHMVDGIDAASVKEQVAGLHLVDADCNAGVSLGSGRPGQSQTCACLHYVICKSRAVKPCRRTGSGITVSAP